MKKLILKADGLSSAKSRIDDGILAKWDKTVHAEVEDKNSIDIFDVIGVDYWTGGGFTAKRMSAALRSIGADKDVVVNVNSPGGDFFEGAAIYNLLAQHEGKVTVNVIGLAASAASVIAMAGDVINISKVGFLMIHNAWSIVVGNRHDLMETSKTLEAFDKSMIGLYSSRTGLDEEEIEKMMDKDTWINSADAMEKGFADAEIGVKKVQGEDSEKQKKAQARRTIEMSLAREGFSRKERDEIFQKASVRDAAEPVQRDADDWEALKQVMVN